MFNKNPDLEKVILNSVVYFDIFDYPLALQEIYQWIFYEKANLEDLKNILEQSEFLRNKISRKDGFYFLKGREEIIETRKERQHISQRKIKKAKKICKWLLFFNPFIKAVAICNDLAYFNAPEGSDIDLFIITQKNRIWLARFFLVLPLKLFGLRPTKKNKKDKICLSFFITEDNLDLKKIALEEKDGIPDIYFIYWLAQLLPIYEENNIWGNFYQANNWLKNYLPNFDFMLAKAEVQHWLQTKVEPRTHTHFINGFSKKFFKWLQLKILPKNLKEKANQNQGVVINENMLKFHNPDKRDIHRQKWIDKIESLDKRG